MIKNFKIFILFLLILKLQTFYVKADVSIILYVNNQIITNIDIEKEANYLGILNPKFNSLNHLDKIKIAKSSLINEIIKDNEIKKFSGIDVSNLIIDNQFEYLSNILGFKKPNDLKQKLTQESKYTLEEIEKKIKIEISWNNLIYSRYKDQVKINKERLMNQIQMNKDNMIKKILLSEILIKKKADESLDKLIDEIITSINKIGFENTANLYSISESSKLGGNIGWVNENSLNENIKEKIALLKEGEISDPIKIRNNFLILKINKIENTEIDLNEEKELNKLIQNETNKQLNQFSRMYFDKLKINYSINET